MTYEEWEKSQSIRGMSPEAYYAELAWKALAKHITVAIVDNEAASVQELKKSLIEEIAKTL